MNSSAKYPVSFATIDSAEDKIKIQGFGSFKEDQLVSATCQRFQASRLEAMAFTAPTAAELGITTLNVPVTINIRIKTFRDSSEWATDYILNGRPLVLEVLISSTDNTATLVGDKIAAALTAWETKFVFSDRGLPFTFTNVAGVITMTMKDNSLFFQSDVTFKVDKEVSPVVVSGIKAFDSGNTGTVGGTAALVTVDTTTGLRVGDTVTIGTALDNANADTGVIVALVVDTSITLAESITWAAADTIFLHTTALDPTFDGKYLEENARMSLSTTSDSYGISPDEKPYIAGQYASIEFVMQDAGLGGIDGQSAKHAFLGTTRGEVGGTRKFKFTLYMLEGSDMWTGSAGNKVFDIVDWIDDSAISPVLLLADGSVAADAAAWVA